MVELAKAFKSKDAFQDSVENYQLLPFRFIQLPDSRYFLSNEVGEYLVCSRESLDQLVNHQLAASDPLYLDCKSKHFISDGESDIAQQLLALKYRTRQSHLSRFTSLHLFVVTLRCDYSCPYCQVSRQTEDHAAFDMSEETAMKAVEMVFKSPSPQIKIEFQGGEPLLNFDLIKKIVLKAKQLNYVEHRDLEFVIATNLSLFDDQVADFCSEHDVFISTSLDGPEDLHNRNRPRPGKNGYALTKAGIKRVQAELGASKVSALMTTTESSLPRAHDIINEYLDFGFRGVFLRPLSPYGFAVKTRQIEKYDMLRWLEFYKEGLSYILELNHSGTPFIEYYSSVLLQRILTHRPTAYLDLQSPSAAGISVLVYNYNGEIYASDESRMLAEMGDRSFCLGNLHENSYEQIIMSDALLDTLETSMAESVPMCSECAFLPYCGTDPVYHHATQHDGIGHKAFSGFCTRSMGMITHLVELLEEDGPDAKILRGWVS
jgi:uncharacterized protein